MSWRGASLLRKAVAATEGRVQPEGESEERGEEEDRWERMLPELLEEVIGRVVESEDRWPMRKSVVACACVCRRWREITTGIVGRTRESGVITFPSSLKQPGPKELPLQCFIKRNRVNATFHLYLSMNQTFMDKGKFLLAARRVRRGAFVEYIISLDADDISQGNTAYVGKLSSDFLGTNFTIYDCKPPFCGAKALSNRASRRFASKQISPEVPSGNFLIGSVSYKFNFLRTRGPRRMVCKLQNPVTKVTPKEESCKNSDTCSSPSPAGPIILKNNAPRWHQHLQCWCLNFHGRVTVASVKNFQLAAADNILTAPITSSSAEDDTVLLQFGKIGADTFTMDFRQPLSAFQAFAISLTSFGTKVACE